MRVKQVQRRDQVYACNDSLLVNGLHNITSNRFFFGLFNHAVKKECKPTTCKNGGTCTEIAIGRHLCTCPVGFLGENCEGEC